MEPAGMARFSAGHNWDTVLTGALSMATALGVAWFGVLKDRRDRQNPLGEQTLRSFKELTELQEQHIEALKSHAEDQEQHMKALKSHAEDQAAEIARLTERVAELEGELSRIREALSHVQPEGM